MPPGLFNEEDEKEQRASDEEGQERSGKEGQTDPTKGGGGAQSVSLRTLQTSENIAWGTLTIGWDVARHSRHLSHAIPGCEDPYGVTTVQKHSMLGCSLSSDGLVHGYGQGLEASRRPQKGDTVGVLLDQQSATVIFHVNGKLVHSPSSRHAADPPWRTASKTNAVSSLPVGSSARFDIPNSSGYVLIPTVTLFQHLPGWYDPKSVEGVEDLAVREEEAEKQEGVRSAKHEIHRSRPPVCQVAINYTENPAYDDASGPDITCDDIDECSEMQHDCHSNATCTNSDGSFSCDCNTGFFGDGVSCSDIDECAGGNHTCEGNSTCVDVEGSFECPCYERYSDTGLGCTTITCSKICNQRGKISHDLFSFC
uniref:EGF-like domain-containing protein n=1 Tax=Chromera velia CCMP2878 TaxID=1169474 RepID=A0A0G4I1U1_9ALVE|eukprot:Cvel_10210.t1-p1 / transcript=Cvel_10210.t1 / gene=Cvel_10210 / organism=Chromera_velia_CCMP2878 / gene_product=Fibrillin-1, putative / transcript_product=Fibrillin-1, putative / location=Cvel_scaffold611:22393-31482(+) / protein_length=366 / sequence_SO=supercontig / SO=protein_coding / is_pseudo=false